VVQPVTNTTEDMVEVKGQNEERPSTMFEEFPVTGHARSHLKAQRWTRLLWVMMNILQKKTR
jgi:hypothetical protein